MAKSKGKSKDQAEPLELPAQLLEAMEAAKKVIMPRATVEEEEQLPKLFGFLTPMMVTDPKSNSQSGPKRLLREPLALVSWDRRIGAWKVSLSDKALNIGGSWPCSSLLTSFTEVEIALATGKFVWSEREVL